MHSMFSDINPWPWGMFVTAIMNTTRRNLAGRRVRYLRNLCESYHVDTMHVKEHGLLQSPADFTFGMVSKRYPPHSITETVTKYSYLNMDDERLAFNQ